MQSVYERLSVIQPEIVPDDLLQQQPIVYPFSRTSRAVTCNTRAHCLVFMQLRLYIVVDRCACCLGVTVGLSQCLEYKTSDRSPRPHAKLFSLLPSSRYNFINQSRNGLIVITSG